MNKQDIYNRACDRWNEFVQEVFEDWCEENDLDSQDPDVYEEFCESEANAGLIQFREENA